ncbi:MAG: ABC transporter permease [Omnitrophica WOR_2 bacterium]
MEFWRLFRTGQPSQRRFTYADILILAGIAALLFAGVRLAISAPMVVEGPEISLSPSALPYYASLSLGRMAAAYLLSVIFTLVYGRIAAYNRRAERILIPLLDVLQSVPILSFLPVVLLSFSAIFPEKVAAELASIVLIFTGQAWNLTFAWYQSLSTIPKELREASKIFRFNSWYVLKTLEIPFSTISFIWNSMMSWAGGWFYLMAAEIFTVGQRDFRLPGLGAYLQEAANQGNLRSIFLGIGVLVLLIICLDQLLWRPLLAWSARFKVEMVESENPPTSWFYDLLSSSRFFSWLSVSLWQPLVEKFDNSISRIINRHGDYIPTPGSENHQRSWTTNAFTILALLAILYGVYRGSGMLFQVPFAEWGQIGMGVLATLGRVLISLVIALIWTIPVGVAIGTTPRLAGSLQPVVQILASVPATALFPAFLLVFLRLPHGVDLSAEFLMLMGTQWYLLFNVIAGAAAIPQDLKYTARILGLNRWERWRTLILPALFPFIVTGAITAGGGAWNASIVAEHIQFAGKAYTTVGIGATIANATSLGNYPLLLASTLSMILAVVLINRLFWRRLYRIAEDQFRLE